ncbi:hypothetical protein LCGC14_2061070 [marine sediment metagenome]|uniref:Uncharacterized protein n=1 Tax=marine sediment metagenome TaxID=412755 RepID=A0A0F9HI37_9ZZZZ
MKLLNSCTPYEKFAMLQRLYDQKMSTKEEVISAANKLIPKLIGDRWNLSELSSSNTFAPSVIVDAYISMYDCRIINKETLLSKIDSLANQINCYPLFWIYDAMLVKEILSKEEFLAKINCNQGDKKSDQPPLFVTKTL